MAANMRMTQSRYMCDKNKSESQCMDEFISDHPQFEYIYVPGDGNCLFHTLAEFYRRSGRPDPPSHEELRSFIVQKFNIIMEKKEAVVQELLIDQDYRLREEQQKQYKQHAYTTISYLAQKGENVTNAVIELSSLQPIVQRNLETIIAELGQSSSWYNAAFDLMVDSIPAILNVNLSMYIVRSPTENRPYISIDNVVTTPNGGPEVYTTIYLLLSENHYGLLYPKNSRTLKNMIRINKEVLEQRSARKAAELAGVPYSQVSELARQQSPAMPAAMPAASGNNNLNVASIAASFNSLHLNNERRRQNENAHLSAALANSLRSANINTRRRQKEQVKRNAAFAASLNIGNNNEKYANELGINNGININTIKTYYPYQTTTRDDLRRELNRYKIPYNLKNKKEALYGAFLMAYKEDINKIKSQKKGGTSRKARRASRKNK